LVWAAADRPLPVFVDGVRFAKGTGCVVERDGSALIEAVHAVRIFDGLLSFSDRSKVVRVTINMRTMNFVVGQKTAYLEGTAIVLPAAPLRLRGDVYLPLVTVARLASSRVAIDRERHIVSIRTGGGDDFPPPNATARQADIDDVEPSPAEALSVVTSATIDAKGLHASASVRNTTSSAYKLTFPSEKQLAFVLSRDGEEVWDSSVGKHGTAPSTLVIGALATTTVTATDPDFAKLAPGRYLLRLRLETLIPLDMPPISLGALDPGASSPR
jgi:hypothetical protein